MKQLRADRLLFEAIIVGISTIIVGIIVQYILKGLAPNTVEVPTVCKDWNKHHIMEISLFLTGALLHIGYEITGANTWYCTSRVNYQ